MKCEIDGIDIRISFIHYNPANKKLIVAPWGTICELSFYDNGILAQKIKGYSTLSEDDWFRYNKEIGRKISLTRALENCQFDKEARKFVWDAYLGRKTL